MKFRPENIIESGMMSSGGVGWDAMGLGLKQANRRDGDSCKNPFCDALVPTDVYRDMGMLERLAWNDQMSETPSSAQGGKAS